jgi:hypothetical protein
VRLALNHPPRHHFLLAENDASEAEMLDKAFAAPPDCGTVALARNISEAKAYSRGAGIYSNREKFRVPSTLASWRLDEDSGVDLLAWVKSDENLRRIPFVLLTPAAASPKGIAEAKAIAAVRVARKPGNSDDLKACSKSSPRQCAPIQAIIYIDCNRAAKIVLLTFCGFRARP